jgi:hypothetical protein
MNRWPWWYRAPIVATSLLPLVVSRRAYVQGYRYFSVWNAATACISTLYWAYPTPMMYTVDRINAWGIIVSHLWYVLGCRPYDGVTDLYLYTSGVGVWCYIQSMRHSVPPVATVYHAVFHILGNLANIMLYTTKKNM